MTSLTNTFEGITPSGTTITLANSGGASGNAFNVVTVGAGGSVASDSAQAMHGTLSAKFVATGAASYVQWTGIGSVPTLWFRLYLYVTANPAAQSRVMSFQTSAGTVCGAVYISATGKVIFGNTSGVTVLTTTNSVNLNGWTRIEGFITGSATVGQEELKLYLTPDSATADETQTSAANLNTAGTIDRAAFGPSNAVTYTEWLDDIGTSTTGYLGPSVPVISVSAALAGAGTASAAQLTGTHGATGWAFGGPGAGTWTCPPGITAIKAECWGPGAAGDGVNGGGGGGGGEYAAEPALAVTPGHVYAITLAGPVTVAGDSVTVTAHGGGAPPGTGPGGAAGTGSTNTVHHDGGAGGPQGGSGSGGAGGGGGGGYTAAGNMGSAGNAGGAGAIAVSGGGPGGAGDQTGTGDGAAPVSGNGGGGGAAGSGASAGGAGWPAQVVLTYTAGAAALAGAGTGTATASLPSPASLSGEGTAAEVAGVTIGAPAAVAGDGEISATEMTGISAGAVLAGSGAEAAVPVISIRAAPGGSGDEKAVPVISVAAALAGAGTLKATVTREGALAGAGAASSGARIIAPAAPAGDGEASGTATLVARHTAAPAGDGEISGVPAVAAPAALAGDGEMTCPALVALPVTAELDGAGDVSVTTSPVLTAALAGAGLVTAVPTVNRDLTAVAGSTKIRTRATVGITIGDGEAAGAVQHDGKQAAPIGLSMRIALIVSDRR